MKTVTDSTTLLFANLSTIIIDNVPVMATDRFIPRKEQAALARKLFKSLGLRGISVTTPNYSMASSVYVTLPELPREDSDFEFNGHNYQNESWSDMPNDVPAKAKTAARNEASRKVGAILEIAFPNHDDRSDYQSDYFDSCWSIH